MSLLDQWWIFENLPVLGLKMRLATLVHCNLLDFEVQLGEIEKSVGHFGPT